MIHNNTNTTESVLRTLRSLMPTRVLTLPEALQRAELQAGRLLELHQLTHGPVPTEIVTELPRVRQAFDFDLPTSGLAHWDGTNWVLTVNAGESETRQRFSLMHEFKHVLDHPIRHLLPDSDSTERIADYFAACVLMPKTWVKRAWFDGIQHVERLAAMFAVSPAAMRFRLDQLGLSTPDQRRCRGGAIAAARAWREYRAARPFPISTGVVR